MLKNRKLNRKKNYDYNWPGSYFVTIKIMNNFFGYIHNNKMFLSSAGSIANQYWCDIVNHFDNVMLDEFVIMPDHVHGILHLLPDENFDAISAGTRHALSLLGDKKNNRKYARLSVVIGSYKSAVTKTINKAYPDIKFKWQRSFHDRIIRSERELNNVRLYIYNNPQNWGKKKETAPV